MANAAATLVGQNLGASRPDRAEKAVWQAARYNLIFLGVVGVLFLLGAPALLGLFSAEAVVAVNGTQCLRIVAAGFFFYAYGMVMGQAFNGAGDTRTPTWLNIICFWLFELPVAWVLARATSLGAAGAFLAIALSFSLMAVLSVVIFRRGTWKSVRLDQGGGETN
jgi:Na+-driven multidrug efflux pump